MGDLTKEAFKNLNNSIEYNQTAHEETDLKIEAEEEELEKSLRQELFIESEESTNKENESSK